MRQRGAALAVSLILLLVMTILGIAAMNGARLEISMAGIMQQEEVALRRAERSLAFAETAIETIATTDGQFEFGSSNDGYYLPGDELNVSFIDWSSIDSEGGPVFTANGTDDDDEWVVEYLGAKVIPGNSQGENPDALVAGGFAYTYRITTRSAIGSKGVRIVESIYTTVEAP
ncbi:MAG: PilX N-terminal domain-containing pilus assembly protein [Halioglobus sp.]|nr:PilX N-terminal domain-containing pilus assembly protein [Halioglobus sp.]